MLSWRVVRGARLGAMGRWLTVVGAAGGAGLLLLSALGWALGHAQPGTGAGVRLVWCLLPVAVTVHLAAAVARAQPLGWPDSGLAAVGLGKTATVLIGAAGAALACAVGSGLALLLFVYLRGDLGGVPYSGSASGVLGAGHHLPVAGAATLLSVVPLAAAGVAAAGLWQPRTARKPGAAPVGLPWGVALTAVGLAVQVSAPRGDALPLPSGLGSVSPATAAGWLVASAGLVVAGPGLVHLCGRLLALHRPGALRLLAGRALQQEARRIGRPLGLLCATATAAVAAYDLQNGDGQRLGPLTAFAAGLIGVCVLAIAGTAVLEARSARARSTAALRDLGASPGLLRGAVALRAGVLLAVAIPLTAVIAGLATVPATR
ncbi:hypothetical protein [Actinacidiphila bryophytorum]|uniref:Uncharacterized protein n=1 Tax=Actinacidiphila bryophytorum TaxID=1436133 RepID=A0A9W4E2Z9_9ACTN|nr:hypothetical protein [Actinacidiphila bryophytorum]MBM9435579.1 hypothetical protein [Actinacidiphila bryophytorum]MBN6543069.1 hypothetical protein [Actinacidiphila bryophytorum]CAG7609687.1 conserved membrane hypothetical protein [Actinacidiphila bryophytorum]